MINWQFDIICLYHSVFICILLQTKLSRCFEYALLKILFIAVVLNLFCFILLKNDSKSSSCKNCQQFYVGARFEG